MNIMLMVNFDKPHAKDCMSQVVALLQRHRATVLMDEKLSFCAQEGGICYAPAEEQIQQADVVVVIGGDGTIIHAAKYAHPYQVPVLGINAGRLGFLAALERHEIEELSLLFEGAYCTEERMLLEVVRHTKQGASNYTALNDVVFTKYNGITAVKLPQMVEIETFCDSRFVSAYRADGVLVSTATGSTAYGLSARGPVMEPHLQTMALTPICPHSLFDRTIVFSAEHELTFQLARCTMQQVVMLLDGENPQIITPEDRVVVKQSSTPVKMINLLQKTFYEVLQDKFATRGKEI